MNNLIWNPSKTILPGLTRMSFLVGPSPTPNTAQSQKPYSFLLRSAKDLPPLPLPLKGYQQDRHHGQPTKELST